MSTPKVPLSLSLSQPQWWTANDSNSIKCGEMGIRTASSSKSKNNFAINASKQIKTAWIGSLPAELSLAARTGSTKFLPPLIRRSWEYETFDKERRKSRKAPHPTLRIIVRSSDHRFICYVEFQKPFNSVNREWACNAQRGSGIAEELTAQNGICCTEVKSKVQSEVCHDCITTPILFLFIIDATLHRGLTGRCREIHLFFFFQVFDYAD